MQGATAEQVRAKTANPPPPPFERTHAGVSPGSRPPVASVAYLAANDTADPIDNQTSTSPVAVPTSPTHARAIQSAKYLPLPGPCATPTAKRGATAAWPVPQIPIAQARVSVQSRNGRPKSATMCSRSLSQYQWAIARCSYSKEASDAKQATTWSVTAKEILGPTHWYLYRRAMCGPTGLSECDAATPVDETCNGVMTTATVKFRMSHHVENARMHLGTCCDTATKQFKAKGVKCNDNHWMDP